MHYTRSSCLSNGKGATLVFVIIVFFQQYFEMDKFLRESLCKYLDDQFTLFDANMKVAILLILLIVFKII